MKTTYLLSAGHILTVTASDATATVNQVEDPTIGATLLGLRTRTFGPYLVERRFTADSSATVTIAAASLSTQFGGVLMLNAGAPEDAVQAALSVNPTGDDNALIFTARVYGAEGNRVTVRYVDPSANDASLTVGVSGATIVVSLATDGGGTITSTAADVLAAIEASILADRLVSVVVDTSDSGTADDGSGVVTAMSSAPLTGGAGTGVDTALPGALCLDITNGVEYRNTGTQAVPVWTASVTTAAYAATAATANALAALHLYGAGVPVDYTDGTPPATGEGTAPKGAIYSDTTNGFVYRNSGTQAQPIWTKLGDALA